MRKQSLAILSSLLMAASFSAQAESKQGESSNLYQQAMLIKDSNHTSHHGMMKAHEMKEMKARHHGKVEKNHKEKSYSKHYDESKNKHYKKRHEIKDKVEKAVKKEVPLHEIF